ncbi:MAG: ABC transporter permease [Candidatus Kapabacteria bacterium]|jgi:ABC-2 type transport system permease protein|nr:ABC transporter permease [Candidatus Kapabacteria bacterium]
MNFQKLFAVARWEFIEKARTKAFIISLLLTPAIMILFGTLPSLLALRGDDNTKKFAFYDETMALREPVQAILNQKYKLKDGRPNFDLVPVDAKLMNREAFLKDYSPRIFNGDFTGLFIIPANVEEKHLLEYRSDNVGNIRDIKSIESAIEKVLTEQAAVKKGIDLVVFKSLSQSLETTSLKISKSGDVKESGFLEVFGVAYASVLILFILILGTGQILVRGLVEEKSNRIMEILVSSCSPFELMMGKLIGLSGLGIVQAMVWSGFGVGAVLYFGVSVSALGNIPLVLVFMLFGYLLYASLLLGLGSITTTDQEAQQITSYVSLLLVVPMTLLTVVLQNPNSVIAKVLSFIPFTAPTIMAMRISIQLPPIWEIALSLGILLVSTVIITYFAAKIFRLAILVYGKRPTLPEVLAFLKEK